MLKFNSITSLYNELKLGLETQYYLIQITGEISKITPIQKGNIFFDIKDENHIISCFALNQHILKFKNQLQEGKIFNIVGKLTIFKGAKLNLLVYAAEYVNQGLIEESKNQLFLKLQKEGYFLPDHKKSIKNLHNSIGLITSKQGAVIHDIINRLQERYPKKIFLYDTKVQGLDAINEIIIAINYFNLNFINKIDAILIARGGGNTEDINIFNNEKLVKGIFNSKIPIISAIGHTQDKTLTDLVADVSTSTPTSAAEYLSSVTIKDYHQILTKINNNLLINQKRILLIYQNKLKYYHHIIIHFKNQLKIYQNKISYQNNKISHIFQNNILNHQLLLNNIYKKITSKITEVYSKSQQIKLLKNQINLHITSLIYNYSKNILHLQDLNNTNNITNNLNKGYSILTSQNLEPISSIHLLKANQEYLIHLKDGNKKVIIQKD